MSIFTPFFVILSNFMNIFFLFLILIDIRGAFWFKHAFDIDAATEPIEETGHDMADLPADLDDMAVEGAFAEDNAG